MPFYGYHALDSQGKPVQGEIFAVTREELVSVLQRKGLFLVSWEILEIMKSSEPSVHKSGVADIFTWLEPGPTIAAVIGLGLGLLVGFLWVCRPPRLEPAREAICKKLVASRNARRRRDFERIFEVREKARERPKYVSYVEPGGYVLDVLYGPEGGPESPDNRVHKVALRTRPRGGLINGTTGQIGPP
jgi:hypothetical protein